MYLSMYINIYLYIYIYNYIYIYIYIYIYRALELKCLDCNDSGMFLVYCELGWNYDLVTAAIK